MQYPEMQIAKKKFHYPMDICFFGENVPKNEILFIFICKTVVQL